MIIKVEIFSCYELTYSRIYKDVVRYLYPDYDPDDTILNVKDVSKDSRGKDRTIQAQRSSNNPYVARTLHIFEDDKLVHIVGISNTNFDYDKENERILHPEKKYKFGEKGYHGNSYLLQGIAAYFNLYFSDKKIFSDVVFSLYLLDLTETYPHNLFNILSYRELQTIGFRILNIDKVNFAQFKKTGVNIDSQVDIGYRSINKYMNDVKLISQKNGGNNPSFLQCNEHLVSSDDNHGSYYIDKYIYTFKTLSAQAYDTMLRIWCLKVLADKEKKEIEFILGSQFFDYDADELSISDSLTGPVLEVLSQAGIEINFKKDKNIFMEEKAQTNETYLTYKDKDEIRNQTLFRNNLRKKNMPCCCALCNIDNESLLDAAHIWDVASIKSSEKNEINNFLKINRVLKLIDTSNEYSGELFYKKYSLANSGENGVWLCANHHKLFDKDLLSVKSINRDTVNRRVPFEDEYNFVLSEADETEQKFYPIDNRILTKETKAFVVKRNTVHHNK